MTTNSNNSTATSATGNPENQEAQKQKVEQESRSKRMLKNKTLELLSEFINTQAVSRFFAKEFSLIWDDFVNWVEGNGKMKVLKDYEQVMGRNLKRMDFADSEISYGMTVEKLLNSTIDSRIAPDFKKVIAKKILEKISKKIPSNEALFGKSILRQWEIFKQAYANYVVNNFEDLNNYMEAFSAHLKANNIILTKEQSKVIFDIKVGNDEILEGLVQAEIITQQNENSLKKTRDLRHFFDADASFQAIKDSFLVIIFAETFESLNQENERLNKLQSNINSSLTSPAFSDLLKQNDLFAATSEEIKDIYTKYQVEIDAFGIDPATEPDKLRFLKNLFIVKERNSFLGDVLIKLFSNQWDFGALSIMEQQIVLDFCTKDYKTKFIETFGTSLGLDNTDKKTNFRVVMDDFFDLQKDFINIPSIENGTTVYNPMRINKTLTTYGPDPDINSLADLQEGTKLFQLDYKLDVPADMESVFRSTSGNTAMQFQEIGGENLCPYHNIDVKDGAGNVRVSGYPVVKMNGVDKVLEIRETPFSETVLDTIPESEIGTNLFIKKNSLDISGYGSKEDTMALTMFVLARLSNVDDNVMGKSSEDNEAKLEKENILNLSTSVGDILKDLRNEKTFLGVNTQELDLIIGEFLGFSKELAEFENQIQTGKIDNQKLLSRLKEIKKRLLEIYNKKPFSKKEGNKNFKKKLKDVINKFPADDFTLQDENDPYHSEEEIKVHELYEKIKSIKGDIDMLYMTLGTEKHTFVGDIARVDALIEIMEKIFNNLAPIETINEDDFNLESLKSILNDELDANMKILYDFIVNPNHAIVANHTQDLDKIHSSYLDIKDGYSSLRNMRGETSEQQQDKFQKLWKNIEGDKNLEFGTGEGVCMFVKEGKSGLPGGGTSWVMLNFRKLSAEPKNKNYRISFDSVDFPGNTRNLDREVDTKFLELLNTLFFGEVCKFKKLNNITDFFNYINEVDVSDDNNRNIGKFKAWKKDSDVEFKDGKVMKTTIEGDKKKQGKVAYIGKTASKEVELKNGDKKNVNEGIFYKVDFEDDGVVLSYMGGGYKKKLDYNSFMLFVSEKGLNPYTSEEHDDIIKNLNPEKPAMNGGFRFYSVKHLISAFKTFQEERKWEREQKESFQVKRMYAMLGGMIPGTLGYSAITSLDSSIWSMIQKYKDRPGREKGVHAKGADKFIIDDCLDKAGNSSMEFRYKAAGYLLYSIESGGGPYFRKLASKSGKGLWVKAILGHSHQQTFLRKQKELQDKIQQNPENMDLTDILVKQEIKYLCDNANSDAGFGTQFGSNLEFLLGNMMTNAKVKEVADSEGNKSSFDDIYPAFMGYTRALRPANSLGALQALAGMMDDDKPYQDFHACSLNLILTGFANNTFLRNNKDQFKGICRTYGMPIGMFVDDSNGPKKVAKILDFIAKKKGIDKGFIEAVGWSEEKITMANYAKNLKGLFEKIKKWWDEHGDKMMDSLNYKDMLLLNYKEDNSLDENTKFYISQYFEKVNISKDETWIANTNSFITSYAPYYKHGILNLPAGTVKKFMLDFHYGDFKESFAAGMWQHLINRINSMSLAGISKTQLEFVLKKFFIWFKNQYGNDMKYVVSALGKSKRDKGNGVSKGTYEAFATPHIFQYLTLKKGSEHVPSIVQDAFLVLQELFLDNLDLIDKDMIKRVFGEDFVGFFDTDIVSEYAPGLRNTEVIGKQTKSSDFQKSMRDTLNQYRGGIPSGDEERNSSDVDYAQAA